MSDGEQGKGTTISDLLADWLTRHVMSTPGGRAFDEALKQWATEPVEPIPDNLGLRQRVRMLKELRNRAAHNSDRLEQLRVFAKTFQILAYAIDSKNQPRPALTVQSVIIPEKAVTEGTLIRATSMVWATIVDELKDDWTRALSIPPRVWEEIVAGAYKEAGFDEVVLTPRSSDHGRDVIAIRKGIGSVRILGSVKAYKPGHLVTKEEVHALMGVVAMDRNASKGIFTTTSDFAPRILDDPNLAASLPHRIELMNGERLREWLTGLAMLKGSG